MKPIHLCAFALLAAGLCPGAAQAQVSRVFVSVNGNDANDCLQPAAACRTLNAGIGKVDAQGEVIVIDTGSYAGATITKSVKINAPAGIVAFSATSILVNAPGATVVIRGLTIKALTQGSGVGINIQAAATVLVENCVIDGWGDGIRVQASAGALKLDIKDSTMRNNLFDGLSVFAGVIGAAITVDQSRFERNLNVALQVEGPSKVSVTRSFFSGNNNAIGTGIAGAVVDVSRSTISGSTNNGVQAGAGTIRVAESLVTGNSVGLLQQGGTLESFKDNIVRGNTTDTVGTITMATRQ